MNEYEKIARETRKKVSKLTLEQQKDLLDLYNDVIKELAKKAEKSKSKSLTKRWTLDYKKELIKAKNELAKEIDKQIKGSIKKAAEIGTEAEQLIMKQIFQLTEIDPGDHFTTMFSQVQNGVIEDIISGNLYKDNKTLSSRIWNYSNEFEKDIQYTINRAITEKKSAIELAKDLETYVKDKAKRSTTWAKCYPHLKNKKVDYNAMRLARTSINHAYQTATIKSSSMNPFVEGIEWWSSLQHGRTCDICRERHEKIFPKDDVPLDHPNGLCTMIPYIPKSLDEVADELRGWLDGEINTKFDDWYEDYGDYFAFKKIGESYNFSGKYTKKSGIIKLQDIQIGKSLGAAAFKDPVKLPNGKYSKLTEGSKITKVVVFAGKGTKKPVKVAKYLSKQYGVPESEWKKVRGDGFVDEDGISKHAELHWFESSETGRIKMKVKRWFD